MNKTDEYRQWASKCPHLPVFMQPWYLDVACPGAWESSVVKDKAGKVIGVLPYIIRKKWGFQGIDIPVLTAYLGPWYDFPENLKPVQRYALEHEVQAALLAQVPPYWFFRQRWHPQQSNALAFRWQGFQLDIKYTYCLDLLVEDRPGQYTSALRNKIRNAEKLHHIELANELDGFYELNRLTFEAQKVKMPYTAKHLQQLFQATQQQGASTLYWACHQQTNTREAAIWVLKDGRWAYLFATARKPDAHNGAVALLIDRAIQDAKASGLQVFDFEGSSLKGIEGFFRQFGGELRIGLVVKKFRFWG